jgi:hypothetical protein
MTTTYTLIEKITVGAAGAATVNFTSIPQTYTDLKIVASTRDTYAAVSTAIYLEFNGNSSGYSMRRLRGSGSAVDSYSDSSQSTINLYNIKPGSSATASTFGNVEIYIPNYTGSTNKSVSVDGVGENNATEAYAVLFAGLWGNTSAITSIKLYSETLFVQYSTFYLYGIAKEGVNPAVSSAPYATGGDKILYDGTYWYHAFTSTGTFTPKKGLSCDVLVVAGGGGGGNKDNNIYAGAGGGGAGGLLAHTNQSLVSATAYTVTIGAGGAAITNGSNSQFGSLTASTGGGQGGSAYANAGATGGSGGGGAGTNTTTTLTNGGSGTSGQGNAGGVGYGNGGERDAGGGGGAGASGGNAIITGAGSGGAGSSTYSSWGLATSTGQNVSGTVYFAGGGGGGAWTGAVSSGGNGGGGKGASNNTGTTYAAVAGTANTGGGGGGAGYGTNGNSAGVAAAGGSGIVIVRYAA